MRRLVVADVHGNLHALEAVLESADRIGFDEIVCAGDLVGYGAFPNECVRRLGDLDALCVAGNHDLIALGALSDDRCVPLAKASLAWTRTVLEPGVRETLAALSLRARRGELVVAHGSLDDPHSYVTRQAQVDEQLDLLARVEPGAKVLVLGHTHRASLLRRGDLTFLNPGSVGQARDWRARARFALLDNLRNRVSFHDVAYDSAAARSALAARGLDEGSLHLRPTLRQTAGRTLRKLGAPV